jgi:hypothetical protein
MEMGAGGRGAKGIIYGTPLIVVETRRVGAQMEIGGRVFIWPNWST